MAKKSKIAKTKRQMEIAGRYKDRRKELIEIIKDPNVDLEEKQAAYAKIAKLPRDSNINRASNRCQLTGRPRGYLRKFKISRNTFRELALLGEIPGVRKSSW